ncbi:MAG: hypothetical protein PHF00_07060, partial [Elusimicrobia bacterium]|nr:hypothetical protein [Elusimicrobiota bacterium]
MNKACKLAAVLLLAPRFAAAQGLLDMVRGHSAAVPSAGLGAPVAGGPGTPSEGPVFKARSRAAMEDGNFLVLKLKPARQWFTAIE